MSVAVSTDEVSGVDYLLPASRHPNPLERVSISPGAARALGELLAADDGFDRVWVAYGGAAAVLVASARRGMALEEVAGLTGLRLELIEAFNQGLAGEIGK